MALKQFISKQLRSPLKNPLTSSLRGFGSVDYVKVVEVGPRDGLQNEKVIIDSDIKVEFINKLSNTGLAVIEATSFVSPKWVPQFADAAEVMRRITRKPAISYPVLVPNLKGLQAAQNVGVDEIAIFSAASEAFTKRNINCTIEESLQRFEDVCVAARKANIKIRGYVSCVAGCPYEGEIDPAIVAKVAYSMLELGCYEISLGDTIGVGNRETTKRMLDFVLKKIPVDKLAIHCHDTYGRALENIAAALEVGVRVVDSSTGGLGGCPYAKGATGNVATEKVLTMLEDAGLSTGVDFDKISDIAKWILKHVKVP